MAFPSFWRRVRRCVAGVLLVVPLLGYTDADTTTHAGTQPALPFKAEITQQINAFSVDLLRQVAKEDPDSNLVLSPQSAFRAMAMTYLGSRGQTRTELAQALHFPADQAALVRELAALQHDLESGAKAATCDLALANACWVDSKYVDWRPEFLTQVQQAFDARPEALSLDDAAGAAQIMNRWAADKTHGKIANVIQAKDLPSLSTPVTIHEPALLLANALYFKADWQYSFPLKGTQDRPFALNATTTRTVPMMRQQALLLYAENDDEKLLMLPYAHCDYSMLLLLPKAVDGLRQRLDALTAKHMHDLAFSARVCKVDVELPRFLIRNHRSLRPALKTLGAASVFDSEKSDLEGMFVPKREARRIYLRDLLQETYVRVDEQGSEAAATTTGVHFSIGCSSHISPNDAEFHADRPFLFLIVHRTSKSVIFASCVRKPEGIQ